MANPAVNIAGDPAATTTAPVRIVNPTFLQTTETRLPVPSTSSATAPNDTLPLTIKNQFVNSADQVAGPPLVPPEPEAPLAKSAAPAGNDPLFDDQVQGSPMESLTGTPSRFRLPTTSSNATSSGATVRNSGATGAGPAVTSVSSPQPPAPLPTPKPQGPDLIRATQFQLADQPKPGEHFPKAPPCIDPRAVSVPASEHDFSPTGWFGETFDPRAEISVYTGKTCQPTQRPAVEWFRRWYDRGPIPASQHWFGKHNPDQFQFIVAGDQRIAYASNTQNGNANSLIAAQTNLDFDLRLTSTERFHWFITPLTQGADSTRWLLDDDRFISEANAELLFGYFEGDLGAMTGGIVNKTLPFDLPFAIGVMPLLIQNGVWMEDAILGVAMTVPAQNMPALNISNIDVTFFAGFDKIDSPAFQGDDNVAKIYAVMSFIEAWNGYVEADYAFLEDRDTARDRSYHNIGIGYTRRYGMVSNSLRVIANAGQSTGGGENTADGVLLLSENSLVTAMPYNLVPYLNLFAGFDRPQSAARQAAAGGVLRNTGILFESDNLTGYPTLDASANQTFGMALGINMLPPDFSRQLILETAMLGTMGDDAGRNAPGAQGGFGARYQLPLTHSVLIRMDAMYGFQENGGDIHGARVELRRKF